nr:unnamed protein product [Leishmania braziliensis]
MTPSKRVIGLWPASGTGGGTVASPLVSEAPNCSALFFHPKVARTQRIPLLPGEWKAASGGLIGGAESAVTGLHEKLKDNAWLGGGYIFLFTTSNGSKRMWQMWT